MTYFDGGMRYDERARVEAVARGERWTARQADRLDTSPDYILEAIKRDWLPEQIERVESKYRLEGCPLYLTDAPERAKGKPTATRTRQSSTATRTRHSSTVSGPTAFALAFKDAVARG